MTFFKDALNGARGELDAWLECNKEEEVKEAINQYVAETISTQQAEINEQARLLGISGERELALHAEIERLKGQRDRFLNADILSNIIRKVDGNNSLGDGALAEAIIAEIEAEK